MATSAMAISFSTPFVRPLSHSKVVTHHKIRSHILGFKPGFVVPTARPRFSCSASMADGQSGDHGKLNLDHIIYKAKEYWDVLPQPVKSFPWDRVLDRFFQLIFNVAAVVIKYLSVPLLAVSSLSEMSYCAHERRLFFVPVPVVLGFAVAGILKETASKLTPAVKDADLPWQLIYLAVFFTLLKLPGPYYPYCARICIPHFANGGLLRVFWMIYSWYQRPESDGAKLQQSVQSL
ncbi:uncharacterized protein LOC141642762 isoform X1 [Silene latifolia]|uniref:uncharacterized protein LOC141642762 isoform X1 n=1 Tax=Silene latifolia TaxID=37657 RepID=UPI003D76B029